MLPTGAGEQLLYCLRFALLGCALGAGYDLVRAWKRVCRPGKLARELADGLFVLAGLGSFAGLFVRGTDGRLRGYLALGLGLGWLLWQGSGSALWTRFLAWGLKELIALGTDVRFQHQLTDIRIEDGTIAAVTVEGPQGTEILACRHLILAPGHSARDTFEMLLARAVPMEPKAFAVGVRIEQRQRDIDAAQYKEYAGTPGLPASTYKLSCHLPDGRAAFSFCVCPGGEVVAAASEEGRVVTNGMSEFARDRENINGALLVSVTPEDFGGDGPLAGVAFQRRLEEAAYDAGGRDYHAPAQRVEDFLAGRASQGPGSVAPSYRPGVRWCDLHDCLPPFVSETIAQALPILGKKLPGYDAPDAVMTAVESRSSSPVRIPRGENGQSPIRGLYPCGEGAGYAGGILSAAADGCRMAEQVCLAIAREG